MLNEGRKSVTFHLDKVLCPLVTLKGQILPTWFQYKTTVKCDFISDIENTEKLRK